MRRMPPAITFGLVVMAMLASPVSVIAQNPVYFTFTVPFTLNNIHPEILSVRAVCEIPNGAAAGREDFVKSLDRDARGYSTKASLIQLKRTPGGYTGDASVSVTGTKNTPGNDSPYRCRMEGCVADGATLQGGMQCAPFYVTYLPPPSPGLDSQGYGAFVGSPDP